MLYLADTHALLWVLTNQKRRLGGRARKAFTAADKGQALVRFSVMTLLELDWLEAAGKLQFKESLEDLVQRLSVAPGYDFVPLTAEIILRSRKFHAFDSIDRLIVATAEELDCPLITADRAIQERNPVPIVWEEAVGGLSRMPCFSSPGVKTGRSTTSIAPRGNGSFSTLQAKAGTTVPLGRKGANTSSASSPARRRKISLNRRQSSLACQSRQPSALGSLSACRRQV